jgi:hypothetical protein
MRLRPIFVCASILPNSGLPPSFGLMRWPARKALYATGSYSYLALTGLAVARIPAKRVLNEWRIVGNDSIGFGIPPTAEGPWKHGRPQPPIRQEPKIGFARASTYGTGRAL